MLSFTEIAARLKADPVKKTLVFPEGIEPRIQEVANYLAENDLGNVILILPHRKKVPSDLDPKIKVILQDEFDVKPLVEEFMTLRNGKATLNQAQQAMDDLSYIGVMLVKNGEADAMLSGLAHTTADTLRPALQIIRTKPDTKLATSVFIMQKGEENFFFADCALNIKPTSEQLVDITTSVVHFAKSLDVYDPQAVLLSYSTNGSGAGEDVDRVTNAVKILDQTHPDFIYEGEMQFDAAFDLRTRRKKFPTARLTKNVPDVFIFPDLNSGNIGYKIAQRMGGYKAIGPFILGLNRPVNDLSRGASVEDIRQTAIMTLYQALVEDHDSRH
jgi:phosphate acetyltransferase